MFLDSRLLKLNNVKCKLIPSCLHIMVNVCFVKVFDSSLDAVIHSRCAAFGADASYLMSLSSNIALIVD